MSLASPLPAARPSFLSELTLRRVIVAMVLAVAVAAALNPMFMTPFVVLLGRTLVIAMVLLIVFIAAGLWQHPLPVLAIVHASKDRGPSKA